MHDGNNFLRCLDSFHILNMTQMKKNTNVELGTNLHNILKNTILSKVTLYFEGVMMLMKIALIGILVLVAPLSQACDVNIPDGALYVKIKHSTFNPTILNLDILESERNIPPQSPEQLVKREYPNGKVVRVSVEWLGSSGPHAVIFFCRQK